MIPDTALTYLIQGLALGISAAAQPGPFQTYLINQTLIGGWRRGAPVAFAPLLSDGLIIPFIIILLDQLPENFIRAISVAGGIFVLYLAWGLWNQWRKESSILDETPADTTNKRTLWRGMVINILGPGPYIFWTLVSGPILICAINQSWTNGFAFLLGFYCTFTGGMLVLVLIFHQSRRFGPRLVHALILVSIIILTIFGAVLLTQAIRG